MCRNLAISWSNASTGGGGPIYMGTPIGGGCTWSSGCDPTSPFSVDFNATTSPPSLRIRTFSAGQCPTGTPTNDCTFTTPSSSNCTFFQFFYTVTNANCPGLYAAGYRSFTITQ
jgi:hypothetical protein